MVNGFSLPDLSGNGKGVVVLDKSDESPDRFQEIAENIGGGFVISRLRMPRSVGLDGNDKSVDWNTIVAKSRFESETSPDTFYNTFSYAEGWNIGYNGAPEDTTRTAFGSFFENYYEQENVLADEWQLRHYSLQGTQRRLIQTFMPHNDVDKAKQTVQLQAGRFRINDADDQSVLVFDMQTGSLGIDRSAYFNFNTNNVPITRQKDSTGAFTDLPYLNARNEYQINTPIDHVTIGKLNRNGVIAHRTTFLDTIVADTFGEYIFAGSINAEFTTRFVQAGASTLKETLVNNRNGGTIRKECITTNGDCGEVFQVGNNFWMFGQLGASGRYQLCNYNMLGVYTALEIRKQSEGFHAAFTGALKPGVYTMATRPSAATVGEGSLIWVTDAGATQRLQVSDGAGWLPATLGAAI